jgi:uncharacterized protein (TIGR02118 family)
MHKVGFIGRYKDDVGTEAGRAHWEGEHAELTAAVPGLAKYVLNLATQNLGLLGVNDEPLKYHGYAWMWFDDQAAFEAATASDAWSAVVADAGEFLDVDWTLSMSASVDENLVIGGPEGPFKVGYVCRFVDDIRADRTKSDDAHAYWKQTHGGAFGIKVPGIDRYLQNHVASSITGAQPEFDGLSECWFQDREAFEVTMASTEWDEMNGDAFNLFQVMEFNVNGFSAFVDEIHVI